jgi:hypothetical protein
MEMVGSHAQQGLPGQAGHQCLLLCLILPPTLPAVEGAHWADVPAVQQSRKTMPCTECSLHSTLFSLLTHAIICCRRCLFTEHSYGSCDVAVLSHRPHEHLLLLGSWCKLCRVEPCRLFFSVSLLQLNCPAQTHCTSQVDVYAVMP